MSANRMPHIRFAVSRRLIFIAVKNKSDGEPMQVCFV